MILPGVLGGINWSPTPVDAKEAGGLCAGDPLAGEIHQESDPATSAKPAVEYTTLEPLMDVPRWACCRPSIWPRAG